MSTIPSSRLVPRTLLLLALAACGGGDGGTPPPPPPPPAPTAQLSSGTVALQGVGSVATLTATGTPADASVVWSVAPADIASITASGRSATVRAVRAGTARVIATASSGGRSAAAEAALTVTPVVRSVALPPPGADVFVGDRVALVPTVTADSGANAAVNWSTSAPAVATVSGAGELTALAPGTTTITATSQANAAAAATLVVTVKGRARGVTVTPALATVAVAGTATFTAEVSADEGVPTTVEWRTSDAAVATVSAAGVATGIAPGTATITAVSTADATLEASASLVVLGPGVQGVVVTPAQASGFVGDRLFFDAAVTADAGVARTVSWSSSDLAVATVDQAGVVTAVGAGRASITAASTVDPSKRGSGTLDVEAVSFPMRWTSTSDAAIGADIPVPLAAAMRPDGVVLAALDGGRVMERGRLMRTVGRSRTGPWTITQTPATATLRAVSAPTNQLAWAVGDAGTIVRRTAQGWVVEPSGTTANLNLLDMRADGTGWAASSAKLNGEWLLLRRDANGWQRVAVPASTTFGLGQLSSAGGALFVTSGASLFRGVHRYLNGTWTEWSGGSQATFGSGLLALSETEALVGGEMSFRSVIHRVSNGTWATEWQSAGQGTAWGIARIVRCADGSVMAQTYQGTAVARTGASWAERPEGRHAESGTGLVSLLACRTQADWFSAGGTMLDVSGGAARFERLVPRLDAVATAGPGFAVAVGASAHGLRWDGTTWHPFPTPYHIVPNNPAAAAVGPASAMVVVNDYLGTWNGSAWSWTRHRLPAADLWGSAANDVWSVGSANATTGGWGSGIYRFNGSTWYEAFSPRYAGADFVAVHGAGANAVFAVGVDRSTFRHGIVARGNATAIVVDTIPNAGVLTDVVVFSATSAVAVGQSGRAYRWDGATWTAMPAPTFGTLTAVTGRSIAEITAFDSNRAIWGWNGTRWFQLGTTPLAVRGARSAGNAGIAVGEAGMVVYGASANAARRMPGLGRRR